MGFSEEKCWLLVVLEAGEIVHDFRGLDSDKNWLSDGRLNIEEACALVALTRGDQSESRPHHDKADLTVWIFKPVLKGKRWYIKFQRTAQGRAKFLSFHPSEEKS